MASGSSARSIWSWPTSHTPVASTARAPMPVTASLKLAWSAWSLWKASWALASRRLLASTDPVRCSSWPKESTSRIPWTLSTRWALSCPSSRRTAPPRRSERFWARNGDRARSTRNGARASISGQPTNPSTVRMPAGTTTAMNAGVMVWAKKSSTVSTSAPAMLTKSPERRRVR